MSEKILIVDDERALREVLTARLEYAGYAVESAKNGREAIGAYFQSQYMEIEPISLIIMDIMMPGTNGLEVLQIIRKSEEARRISYENGTPVIMLTALKEAWMESFNRGCDDYLTKPYEAEELIKKVVEKLEQRRLNINLMFTTSTAHIMKHRKTVD
ncbi:MAG: response regulator transcription factor [bacterium]